MTRKIRSAAVVALGAGIALAVAGCSSSGGGTDNNTGSTGGDTSKPVSMTLWTNATTGPGAKFFEDTVASFHTKYPNVTIKIQTVQNEDLDGKLQTALNSGDAPDIFLQRGGGKMKAMVDAGQLLDITDSVAPETKDKVAAGAFAAETIDNKLYAMPASVLPGGFFYSKDLLTAAKVSAFPTSLDELNSAVTAIKGTNKDAIALGGKDAWPAAHWYYWFALRECSQDALNSTAKSLKFEDECWTRAGNDLKTFAATKPFNNGFLTTSAQQGANSSAGLVANHKAAMELMGAWDPGVIGSLTPDKKALPDLAFSPFITVPNGQGDPKAIMGGVDGYSCSAKAPKQACTDFLNYLASTDIQKAYYTAFQAPPVNKDAQALVTDQITKDVINAFNSAPYVSQWLDTLYGQNVGNALNTAVVNLLAGKGDVAGIISAVNAAAAKG
ncbi:ABC transporter substrate-binding protein [Cellulomonas alba]|uniref:Extracellular solute-binding protein n=1 Tax=Cellulomonas alba TaxID=3053467 RepID=A0ABT7SD76_9CELL|nr:extracellular solute-binding protein [Cellulomonas alba]MDM7854133.1 extracellular solute-binding protein [Cellulomonas alba]